MAAGSVFNPGTRITDPLLYREQIKQAYPFGMGLRGKRTDGK